MLSAIIENELPDRHNEFLKEFLLKLLDKLAKQDKEGFLAAILVEVGLDMKEVKTIVD